MPCTLQSMACMHTHLARAPSIATSAQVLRTLGKERLHTSGLEDVKVSEDGHVVGRDIE